jgi:DNA-3-methyladenine glycosylase
MQGESRARSKNPPKSEPGPAPFLPALPGSFFERPAEDVALGLLGKALVRRRGRRLQAYIITETEAYVGPEDLACHAARGRTKRNEIMFGRAGTFYVYLIYGMHWMLNVVTGEVGYPAAVLLRGVERIEGPGRLTKALGVTTRFNGKQAVERTSLWFADLGQVPRPDEILRTARIGVDYAGPIWSAKEYRFLLKQRGEAGS